MAEAPPPVISIVIADDHPVVRQGLRSFLDLQDDFAVIGEAGDGDAAVELILRLEPDVVLLDLEMPGRNGIEVLRALADAGSAARAIVLTSFQDEERLFPALEAGAAGYLLKEIHPFELRDAIRRVHAGQGALDPSLAGTVMGGLGRVRRERLHDRLTQREREVLALIAAGLPNRGIARELGIAEKTVKTHVSGVLAKLGVSDRTQAALYAVQEGLAPDRSGGALS